ncbi:hypothetical protein [Ruegeria sp. HKCCA4812]|uniref:hypothetical protein n=1 Tax=Ruegeria sp. HKCCA4812 TaxID=2682993 RepID=UPI00148912D7|nr:hypothetical protein [Ruegeria sp. HKCCA4812]
MKSLAAALALITATPVFAEASNEQNTVLFKNGFKITVLSKPVCESAEKYNTNWDVFRQKKGLGRQLHRGAVQTKFGAVDSVTYLIKGGEETVTFGYVPGNGDVCLLAFAEPSPDA